MSDQDSTATESETVEETAEDKSVKSGQEPDAAESGQEPEESETDWRDDFDANRAKKTIEKLREDLRAAKADKTPQDEKDRKTILALKDQAARVPDLESTVLRYEVAYDLGLPKELVPRLKGSTREELLADAESLIALVAPTKRPTTQRPTEALRGGLDPDNKQPDETDLKKLGERMFSR